LIVFNEDGRVLKTLLLLLLVRICESRALIDQIVRVRFLVKT